ncbi:MAG TPA: nucleoside deaminase [Chitinophagales bacterium]
MNINSDEHFMRLALNEAKQAEAEDEVPIGAVIVANGKVIGKGYNQTERLKDVTAHAEMLAITAAANYLDAKFLETCTLYVTLEPCPMCAAALRWARIGKIVYAAPDEKLGYSTISTKLLHPKTELQTGVLQHECATLITNFFKQKRTQK